MNTYTCKHCGKEFKPKAKDRITFCSRECAFEYKTINSVVALRNAKKEATRASMRCQCGQPVTHYKTASPCCDECYKKQAAGKSRAYSEKKKRIEARVCAYCGKEFSPVYGDKKRVFCSDRCCKADARWNRKAVLRYKANNSVLSVKTIHKSEVVALHGCTCWLCGQEIDRAKGPTDKMGFTIDHITPLSKGGSHALWNVKPAHRLCNSLKGDKLVDVTTGEGYGPPISTAYAL